MRTDAAVEPTEAVSFMAFRGLLSATGESFFRSLMAHLEEALGADFAFVCEPIPERPGRVRTIALLVDGREAANVEYDLCGTPCERVIRDGLSMHPEHVQARFPDDAMLAELGIESYVGVRLLASDGRLLGILSIMSRTPFVATERMEQLMRVYAVRAASELERLKSEQQLVRSNRLLRSILENTAAAVYVKDVDGRYVLINREFEITTGIPIPQALGRTDAEFLPLEDAARIEEHEREAIESRLPVRREHVIDMPGRGERSYIIDKVPLLDADGGIFGTCTMATDITEHQQLQARLVHAQRMQSIGQLAGGVAHDFNNLLTAINGYTAMARESLPAEHPAKRDLAEAEKACRRAGALTAQLLAFARQQVIRPRDVDLCALLEDTQALLRPALGERVQLAVRSAPDLWSVRVDPGQLEQVLMNLAVNARDAMPDGGTLEIVASNVTRSVSHGSLGGPAVAPPTDYIEIRVSDTGQGIPEEVRSRMFEPFFTTKGPGRGTGLGLATCFGIIEQSGGSITFESRVGEGTTFTVLLPRGGETPAGQRPEREPTAARGDETVLVVEDEPLVRDLVVRVLKQSGFNVLEAESGEQALAVAASCTGPIDLMLSDIVMPGTGGPELAAKLQKIRPDTRVLLMSGYPAGGIPAEVAGGQAWPLLCKPYTPLELSVRVREILDAVRAEGAATR